MKFAEKCNTIVVAQTGQGFFSGELQKSILPTFVVVTTPTLREHRYYSKGNVTTIHGLRKVDLGGITHIVIDCPIPRRTSKIFKVLLTACRGVQLVLINEPHDPLATACAMELMSVTKNPRAVVYKYDHFTARFNR